MSIDNKSNSEGIACFFKSLFKEFELVSTKASTQTIFELFENFSFNFLARFLFPSINSPPKLWFSDKLKVLLRNSPSQAPNSTKKGFLDTPMISKILLIIPSSPYWDLKLFL